MEITYYTSVRVKVNKVEKRKKKTKKWSVERWFKDVEEEEYHYRLVAKRSRYARSKS